MHISQLAKLKPCMVQDCRFPTDHLTIAHRCGKCHTYGHGYHECSDYAKKHFLKQIINAQDFLYEELIPLDRRCTLPDCRYSYSHTENSHHCSYCGRRAHSIDQCYFRQNGEIPYSEDSEYDLEFSLSDDDSESIDSFINPNPPFIGHTTTSDYPTYTCPLCSANDVKGIELLDNKEKYECLLCFEHASDDHVQKGFTPMLGLHPNQKIGHGVCLACIRILNDSAQTSSN